MTTFETLPFYRGFSIKYSVDKPLVITPRRDRLPKDSSTHFHKIADNWFKNAFGCAYRSQSVFLVSNLGIAAAHAATPDHIMRVIPISKYRYCWSPKVSDLLFLANELSLSPRKTIEEYLENSSYRQDGLEEAFNMEHEIMLYCEKYIAIPICLLEKDFNKNEKHIILKS